MWRNWYRRPWTSSVRPSACAIVRHHPEQVMERGLVLDLELPVWWLLSVHIVASRVRTDVSQWAGVPVILIKVGGRTVLLAHRYGIPRTNIGWCDEHER